MKRKFIIFLIFLVPFILLAGCGGRGTVNTISEDPASKKVITDTNEFQNIFKGWVNRLSGVAERTDQVYNDWVSGKINKDELTSRTRDLYKETKRLKTECSYNTVFNLSETDKKQINYDLINSSYDKALGQMNDFLRILPTLEDQQIKTSYSYTNKVVSDEIGKLKKHLKI